jgi:probable HAF family extracellular repeat protein
MQPGGLRTRATAAAAALLFWAIPSLGASSWTLIDIGTLGGPGSYGAAISDSGVVAGCADTASGTAHAFIYANGEMHDLGEPGSGQSCALAVNNDGVVAGRSDTGEIVIWRASGVTRLGVKGDVGGIDGSGVVVGSIRDGFTTTAFRYENGVVTTLAGANSTAAGVNARGQVVGTANGHAVLYENGGMRDLGTLGGNGSSARDINDNGQVVGMAADANGQPQPFVFDVAMHPLPGPGYSSAIAINNRGQVVGSAEGTHGYLIENGQYTRLDMLPAVTALGWRKLEPTGINVRGWIVGSATTPSGDLRAFLLVPAADRAPVARVARTGRGPY